MVATFSDSPPPPRRAFGAVIVAVLYTAFLLCAPLLVRYGPDVEVTSASVARVAAHDVATPPCTHAPKLAQPCADSDDLLR